jgi:hypothetical protein
MRFLVRCSVLLVLALAPTATFAQGTQSTATPAATATPSANKAGGGGDGAPSAGDEKKTPPAPTRDAAGYAYDDKKPATGARRALLRKPSGPLVNMPGFEQTTDGGSRLFVQLTQNVQVEERKAQGSITYILKGAHARVHNNTNALVTVHFNTPVSRARLVPAGNDLHFVVELRASASPTWKMADAADKTSMLTIDFPKGEYGTGDNTKDNPAKESQPKPTNNNTVKKGAAKPAPGQPAPAAGPNP